MTNCRLEKCISSGRVCSTLLTDSFAFLPLPFLLLADLDTTPGKLMLPPRVTGAKSSFAISFCGFSEGVKKSILNGSFLSRFALGADASADTSAI